MSRSRQLKAPWFMQYVAMGFALAVMALIAWWVLSKPHIVLPPTPRIVVLALMALTFAIALAGQGSAYLEIRTERGLVFIATASVAVAFAALLAFVQFSRPDTQIAVYHIVEKTGQKALWVETDKAVEVQSTRRGVAPTSYVDGNTIVLVFPEQVETAELILNDRAGGRTMRRPISYVESESTIVMTETTTQPGSL